MRYLKKYNESKLGTLYTSKEEDSNTTQIEVDGYPVKIINIKDSPGCKSIYEPILVLKNGPTSLEHQCFSDLEDAKTHISNMIKRYKDSNLEIDSFIIKKLILDLVAPNIKNTDVETPPKWVKNPKSWAMDKIVALLTPESNIHQLATFYVESGVFNFKDLNKVKTFIKSIYKSSKDKKELDVYDHVRRFDDSLWQNHEKIDWNKVESYTGDKNGQLRKFHNLLSIIQPN